MRDWIKAPGFEDHTTRVHWMQCGLTYADVRIPLNRPDLGGVASLSDLPPLTLHTLTRAEGFAGTVSLKGDHCTWVREVNWHGQTEVTDIGHIAFDDQSRIIETGVEAEYTELWRHERDPKTQAIRFRGAGYTGFFVTVGRCFVLAIDKADRPALGHLIADLQTGEMPDDVPLLWDGLYASGTWTNGRAVATLATQPFSEGAVVLSLGSTSVMWRKTDFYGHVSEVELQTEAALV